MFHLEHCRTVIVQDEDFLPKLKQILSKSTHIFWDTETSGLRVRQPDNDYVVGWTFAADKDIDENVYYLPVAHLFEGEYIPRLNALEHKKFHGLPPIDDEKEWGGRSYRNLDNEVVSDFVRDLFENIFINKIKVAHNQSFDMHLLANEGMEVVELYRNLKYMDTMVMWHTVAEEEEKKLESIVEKAYDIKKADYDSVMATVTADEKKQAGLASAATKATFPLSQIPIGGQYSGEDVFFMRELYSELIDMLKQDETYDYYIEKRVPLILVLWDMEREGSKINEDSCKNMAEIAGKVISDLEYKMLELVGIEFNPGSDQQVYELLFGHKKMTLMKEPVLDIKKEQEKLKALKEKANIARVAHDQANEHNLLDAKHMNKLEALAVKAQETVDKMADKIADKEKAYKQEKEVYAKNKGYKQSYNPEYVKRSFKFPVVAWTAGGKEKDKKLMAPKVDKEVMKELLRMPITDERQERGKEFIKLLMRYNKLGKLKGTYMEGLLTEVYKDGKIHPSFNICGTESGRISCSNPNLLNLPAPLEKPREPNRESYATEEAYLLELDDYKKAKDDYDFWIRFEIRSLFVPSDDDKIMIVHDYTALEKCLTAMMSKDEALVAIIANGIDAHGMTATFLFPEELEGVAPNDVKKVRPDLRSMSKPIGFSMDYGGTEFTVAKTMGCTKEKARELIDRYWAGYKGQAEFNTKQIKFARRNGYVATMMGNRRHISGINSDNFAIRGYSERVCRNAPIQGTGADVVATAQISVFNDPVLSVLGYKMQVQIYDEISGCGLKKFSTLCALRVKKHMESALDGYECIVPLKAAYDTGATYAEAK